MLSSFEPHPDWETRREAASLGSQPQRRQGIRETTRQAPGRYEQAATPAPDAPSGHYSVIPFPVVGGAPGPAISAVRMSTTAVDKTGAYGNRDRSIARYRSSDRVRAGRSRDACRACRAGRIRPRSGCRRARARPVVIETDLALPEASARVAQEALAALGAVDVLVNNAAQAARLPTTEIDAALIDQLMAVNVRAPLLLIAALIPSMTEQGRGCIINLSSVSSLAGTPNRAVYAASKGALDAATRSLAIELGPRGIRVNAVAPGSSTPPCGPRTGLSQASSKASRARPRFVAGVNPTTSPMSLHSSHPTPLASSPARSSLSTAASPAPATSSVDPYDREPAIWDGSATSFGDARSGILGSCVAAGFRCRGLCGFSLCGFDDRSAGPSDNVIDFVWVESAEVVEHDVALDADCE